MVNCNNLRLSVTWIDFSCCWS